MILSNFCFGARLKRWLSRSLTASLSGPSCLRREGWERIIGSDSNGDFLSWFLFGHGTAKVRNRFLKLGHRYCAEDCISIEQPSRHAVKVKPPINRHER